MSLPPVIRDAIRLLFLAVLEHQYVVLFFVVAIEEAGIPLPAPTDARLKNLSVVFSQYCPPSIVFQTPPPVEPK